MDKPKILIVEDEPIVGMELQESLEKMGYSVPLIIDSADDLLKAFKSVQPDLILMDIRLRSFMDGIDAARRLRMISDVPLIYLTAFSNPETQARAEKTQPGAFLTKPVDDATLYAHISRILEKRTRSSIVVQ